MPALVTVTGANGLVGARITRLLVDRGATVRAVVRRAGTAPQLDEVEELVGDVTDPDVAVAAVRGADAVVTTVYPMGSSEHDEQERVSVGGTTALARHAAQAGVGRLVHVSTAAVYDRSPGVGDVDEHAALVDDEAGDYPVIKRDTDTALGEVEGITRVLVRPPAILGPCDSSMWNRLRPATMRDDPAERSAARGQTFAWVHVDDLATLVADLATGAVPDAEDPELGPMAGECTVVNVSGEPATVHDYQAAVGRGVGFAPQVTDGPAWRGRLVADRARRWGWTPRVTLQAALDQIEGDLKRQHA